MLFRVHIVIYNSLAIVTPFAKKLITYLLTPRHTSSYATRRVQSSCKVKYARALQSELRQSQSIFFYFVFFIPSTRPLSLHHNQHQSHHTDCQADS